jgi:hypothetical protein
MGLWSKIKKAVKHVVKTTVDAVVSEVEAVVKDAADIVVHGAKALWYGGTGQTARAGKEIRLMVDSARRLASDILFGIVSTVVAVAIGVISAVQVLFGVQSKPRHLDNKTELQLLQDIYQDELEYDEIRIVEGKLGILKGKNSRPYTVGHTIFCTGPTIDKETLVHESVHIWQFEHGGPRYILEAIKAQKWGGVGKVSSCTVYGGNGSTGYDFDNALQSGKRWPEFNPEQQAQFIEFGECCDHNLFISLAGNLFVPPTPQRPDHDYMPNFVAAVNAIRSGNGAAW